MPATVGTPVKTPVVGLSVRPGGVTPLNEYDSRFFGILLKNVEKLTGVIG